MRIFIGLTEIGNLVTTYAKGFRALGHEVYTMVGERNPRYPDSQYDFVVRDVIPSGGQHGLTHLGQWRRVMFGQFVRCLRSYDVFIFVFSTSFFQHARDYALLKLFGKRLVSVFQGDDVRYWYAFREQMLGLGETEYAKPEYADYYGYRNNFYERQLSKVRTAERYSDLILSQPSMDQLQTRPYMRFNIPLDLSQFRFAVPERQVPLVVHAPSHTGIKGTTYIQAAVEQLRREGVQFEFKLIEGMPNPQLRETLTTADIVIDQVMSTTVAGLALESLATGNVVLARYMPEFSRIPGTCPVVNVTHLNLAEKLREVIVDKDLRRVLAYAGRPYVEKFHDHVHVAGQILDWLRPGGIQQYDFTPSFFRKEFVMPPELLLEEQTRMREERTLDRLQRRRKWSSVLGIHE